MFDGEVLARRRRGGGEALAERRGRTGVEDNAASRGAEWWWWWWWVVATVDGWCRKPEPNAGRDDSRLLDTCTGRSKPPLSPGGRGSSSSHLKSAMKLRVCSQSARVSTNIKRSTTHRRTSAEITAKRFVSRENEICH